MIDSINNAIKTVEATQNSDISKVFPKSYELRQLMNLISEIHSPMHNVNRYSADHSEGDENGRLYKIKGSFDNLFDLWESSFSSFGSFAYVRTKSLIVLAFIYRL